MMIQLPVFLGLFLVLNTTPLPEQLILESDARIVSIPADAIARDMERLGETLEGQIEKEWKAIPDKPKLEAGKKITISGAYALSSKALSYRSLAYLHLYRTQTINGFNGEVVFENDEKCKPGDIALDLAVKKGTRYVVTFYVNGSTERTYRLNTADHQYMEQTISKSGQVIVAMDPAEDGFTRLELVSPEVGTWYFTGVNIQTIN